MANYLWTLADGDQELSARVQVDQVSGWQICVSHNDVIRYRERHPTRLQAEVEAKACRQMLLGKGWTPVPERR